MSGGQQQRVGIARAIALEPEIIFCDESTSALDVSVQKTILELLVKLQKEKQIALGFICHYLAMISSIAHQVAVMYMGRHRRNPSGRKGYGRSNASIYKSIVTIRI